MTKGLNRLSLQDEIQRSPEEFMKQTWQNLHAGGLAVNAVRTDTVTPEDPKPLYYILPEDHIVLGEG